MSTPASTAMSMLSGEVTCACTVLPARCPSSTMTFWARSEKEMKFMSTWPLAPYLRKSTPNAVYARIAARNESGGIQSSSRPVPCSHVSLVRLTKALLRCSADAPRKSGDKGPLKPMMLPAKKIRLPGAWPAAIMSRALASGARGPHVSKTVVIPDLSAICAPSRTTSW